MSRVTFASPVRTPDPASASLHRRVALASPTSALEAEAEANADGIARSIPSRTMNSADDAASSGESRALDPSMRAAFEPRFGWDFSRVRVHTDERAGRAAQALGARAFTLGNDIAFAPGRFAPDTAEGTRLIAHELTHVVQQGRSSASSAAPALMRAMDPAALATADPATIMADDTYIDNNISKVEYYTGELAIIYYPGGRKLELGLTPQWLKPPIQGVDFRTLSAQHIGLPSGPGTLNYIPRGREMKPPPGTTFEDVLKKAPTQAVHFVQDTASGRIVPTEVNSRTAPVLCRALRECEAEFDKLAQATAAGGKKIFERFQTVLEIYSLLPAGFGARKAGEAVSEAVAKRAAIKAATREVEIVEKLAAWFARLIKSGAPDAQIVEGVLLDGVTAEAKGGELLVKYFGIERRAAEKGAGEAMQGFFERAAVKAASEAGLKTARVGVETVTNPAWRAYLESLGYTKNVWASPMRWEKIFPVPTP